MYEQFPIDSFLLYLCEMLQILWDTKPLYFSPDFVSKSQSKGSKRLQHLFHRVYIAIFCLEWAKRRAIYMIGTFAEITQIFYSVLFKYMKENSDPKLTLISKLFMAELGFFKSLKLHFDICNILIYNKMSIKWTDLHCRLL